MSIRTRLLSRRGVRIFLPILVAIFSAGLYFAPKLVPAALAQSFIGSVIPSSRVVSWTPGVDVGVTGGIPNRTDLIDITKAPYNADNTGVNDITAALNSAVNAAKGTGKVVYLPAGTYLMSGSLSSSGSNYSIRGDGDSTVIKVTSGSTPFFLGIAADLDRGSSRPIVGGLTAGSKVLTLSDVSGFSVGQLIRIDEIEDHSDPALPIVSVNYSANTRSEAQMATIKAIDPAAKTITISRGLVFTLKSELDPRVIPTAYNMYSTRIGLEDLKIDATTSGATFIIWYLDVTQSWIKNVHIVGGKNYQVYLYQCTNCEVRHSRFEDLSHAGPNGAIMLVEQVADSLIEDNIFYKGSTHFEFNFGCTGNVFAYNYMEDSTVIDTVGIAIDSNHGPHNNFNLFEGNIAPKLENDGYFGGSSYDTIFRNWFHGTSLGAYTQHPLILKRFTRYNNVVGNILGKTGVAFAPITDPYLSSIYDIGTPNIGNDGYTGTASLINGDPWDDWASYLAGTYNKGIAGFQELDLDVLSTTILKGNWNAADNGIPAGETLSVALPSSLYLSSKPSWFGNLAWPPFNPSAPNQTADALPAGYRFVHGNESYLPGGSGTPAPQTYTLTVAKAGTGSGTVTGTGVSCGSDCSEAGLSSGSSVSLSATAADGSTFAGWSGTCSGTGSCSVSMTDNKTVTATFNLAAATGGGGGSSNPSPSAPVITQGPSVSGITTSSAVISWTTDAATDAQIEYGLTGSYGSNTGTDASLVTSHSKTITGLASNTHYHFRVISKNVAGTSVTSSDATFSTATETTTRSSGGGGGGSSSGSSRSSGGNSANTPAVTQPKAKTSTPILSSDLSMGAKSSEVINLQKYLNAKGYAVATSGAGSPGNEVASFGLLTRSALIRFQSAYGIPATGKVDSLTRTAINLDSSIVINPVSVVSPVPVVTVSASSFTQPLDIGSRGSEVTLLQTYLSKLPNIYPEKLVTGTFGSLTQKAVGRFQEQYGLAKPGDSGYGFVGPKTRIKLNALISQ